MNAADLRSVPTSQTDKNILAKIKTKNVKKFYLGMEFNAVNDTELYNTRLYPFNLVKASGRQVIYTPQINNISLMMPSTALLYNWNQIPKVSWIRKN